ncbi:MAG: hypothetical protein J6Z11_00420 [Candidatus Riflebacteria bacterium]|nr:hypothetical protein [Candidatus Riflebacteria bacterium]
MEALTNMYNNNIIVLNRGDSFNFDLTIHDENAENGRYRLQGDDVLYFGLMDPGQPFEIALVRKRYTVDDCDEAGNLTIELKPEDTIDLIPGVYYYSIKIHLDHDEINPETKELTGRHTDRVITIINKTKFFLND